jgi:hypothetical protein
MSGSTCLNVFNWLRNGEVLDNLFYLRLTTRWEVQQYSFNLGNFLQRQKAVRQNWQTIKFDELFWLVGFRALTKSTIQHNRGVLLSGHSFSSDLGAWSVAMIPNHAPFPLVHFPDTHQR